MATTGSDELAKLRVSRARERLAGHATGHKFDMLNAPAVQMLKELGRVSEIADVPEAAEIRRMCFHCPRVRVSTDQNRESGITKSKGQPASAAEQVDRARSRRDCCPASYSSEIPRVGRIGGRWET